MGKKKRNKESTEGVKVTYEDYRVLASATFVMFAICFIGLVVVSLILGGVYKYTKGTNHQIADLRETVDARFDSQKWVCLEEGNFEREEFVKKSTQVEECKERCWKLMDMLQDSMGGVYSVSTVYHLDQECVDACEHQGFESYIRKFNETVCTKQVLSR